MFQFRKIRFKMTGIDGMFEFGMQRVV